MNENHLHLPGDDPRILVGATGSIAVSELPAYIRALRAAFGGSYTVVLTHTAEKFVHPPAIGLAAERVVHGEDPANWSTDRPSRLAGDHDLVLVLPATAHILAAAATGAAPNRLATVILSSPKPSVFVPHMGAAMWEKPAVVRNVAQLRADGHHVVEPVWESSHDVVTGEMIRHPAIPAPDHVVAELAQLTKPCAAV
jgi:phosphopantothenoylcysteine synthetase/decarboxylase